MRNFLIVEHSLALGTAIHGTPLIAALRAAVPGSRVLAMASGFGAGVLRGHPGLDGMLVTPSPLSDLRAAVSAWRKARPFGREPYAVLQTTGNSRTKIALAAMLSGAPQRVGFSVHAELMEAALAFDGQRSQIENNLRIVDALGHGEALRAVLAARPELAEPVVTPSTEDRARAVELLKGVGLDVNEPFAVLITQTSPTQRKGWRPERFRHVASTLAREYGLQIVLGGSKPEAAAVESLREAMEGRTANLAGKTSLMEMAAVFGMAKIAVTLDTGPMHLGRAMRTPMVVIAPAWSPPVEWLPIDNPRVRILKNLDLPAAPEDYVIDEVSVDEVEEAVRELMHAYGGSAAP